VLFRREEVEITEIPLEEEGTMKLFFRVMLVCLHLHGMEATITTPDLSETLI